MSSSSSACAEIALDPLGRRGIGVDQPQSGSDYPLVGPPSSDIRYLLADAALSYDDPFDYGQAARPFKPPFRIWWLHGAGCEPSELRAHTPTPAHAADVLIIDADRCVVFDSTQATNFLSRAWGPRLHVYAWETDDAVFSLVVHTAWAETAALRMEPRHYDENIYPDAAVLDARVVTRRPKRVKSLKVLLDTFTRVGIDFVEGFNVSISDAGAVVRGSRLVRRLDMAVTPGAGLGIYPGCEPRPVLVTKINGVGPNEDGAFFLGAERCYYLRQPAAVIADAAVPVPAMLKLGNDCSPCCGCEDYVATAVYMNETRNEYHTVGRAAEAVRDQYHDNRLRWLAAKECFENHPLRLVLQPQLCPYLDIAAQFGNLSATCVGPVELVLTFDEMDGISCTSDSSAPAEIITGVEVPGFTFIKGANITPPRRGGDVQRYTMDGEWPVFRAYWDSVEPSYNIWVRFRLLFDCPGVDFESTPIVPRVCRTGTVNGTPIPGPAVCRQATLRCPARSEDVVAYYPYIQELA